MTNELKPCPMCNCEARPNTSTYSPQSDVAKLNNQHIFHGVNCIACGLSLGEYKTPSDAAAAWNRRAPVAEQQTAQWQPISTAPKDGGEVILRNANWNRVLAHWMPGGHCIEDHPPIDAGWYYWSGNSYNIFDKPLHWMPIHAGPTASPDQPAGSGE